MPEAPALPPAQAEHKKVVERMEIWGQCSVYRCAYWLMYVLNPGHTYEEISEGRLHYPTPAAPVRLPENANVDNALLEARRASEAEEARRAVVDEKSKVVLTVSALLLTANAALLPHLPIRWLGLLPIVFVLAAVFLTLIYFRTYTHRVIDWSTVTWSSNRMVRLELARQEFECAADMEPQNALRIGVQKAARRALIIALALMVLPVGAAAFADPSDVLVNRVKADSAARELLRGLPGLTGSPGATGATGPRGQVGAEGRPGLTGPRGELDAAGLPAATGATGRGASADAGVAPASRQAK